MILGVLEWGVPWKVSREREDRAFMNLGWEEVIGLSQGASGTHFQ